MTLIMMIVVAIGVGILAQAWKHRAGALWGLLCLAIMIPTWFVIYFATYINDPTLYHTDDGWYGVGLVVSLGVGVIMSLLVATLPQK